MHTCGCLYFTSSCVQYAYMYIYDVHTYTYAYTYMYIYDVYTYMYTYTYMYIYDEIV